MNTTMRIPLTNVMLHLTIVEMTARTVREHLAVINELISHSQVLKPGQPDPRAAIQAMQAQADGAFQKLIAELGALNALAQPHAPAQTSSLKLSS
ncbi:MAG: hypothetical protein SFZ23_08695 [Planctomycetota bacterium]|nr:hypothetical protein [Planctomycetota bacterium]